eukprot:6484904-Amphidinium_carterae.1
MPQALSGVIATSLSLRHGSSLMVFRSCLVNVIEESLVLLTGSPTASAEEFKNQAMSLFMSGSSTDLVQKVCVALLMEIGEGTTEWSTTMMLLILYPPDPTYASCCPRVSPCKQTVSAHATQGPQKHLTSSASGAAVQENADHSLAGASEADDLARWCQLRVLPQALLMPCPRLLCQVWSNIEMWESIPRTEKAWLS